MSVIFESAEKTCPSGGKLSEGCGGKSAGRSVVEKSTGKTTVKSAGKFIGKSAGEFVKKSIDGGSAALPSGISLEESVGESTEKSAGKPIEESKKFFISTYGCQMNVNDTDRMACLLEMSGYAPASLPEAADLIVINSCSIREKPVHKVHSEAGRYKRLKEKNPRLKIGVAGCVAQQERGRLLKDIPFIDFVLGTDAIDELPSLVSSLERDGKKRVSARQLPKEPYHIETLVKNPKVSAFVNISKGCDNFCSFCVVPFTRGRERSRPLRHILEDIKALAQRGVRGGHTVRAKCQFLSFGLRGGFRKALKSAVPANGYSADSLYHLPPEGF